MSRSFSDCLFISEPWLFAAIAVSTASSRRFHAAYLNIQLAFTRVARMARDLFMIGRPPGERAAQRRDDRVNRVTPTVSHHQATTGVVDLDMSSQPVQDRPPRPQALRFEPAALRLLVVLARQPQAFQRRGRTCLNQNATGGGEAAVVKRQNRRPPLSSQRAEHVPHTEKRLVNDAVVIRIERGAFFSVGQPPYVFCPDPSLRATHAFYARALTVISPLA